MSRYKDFAYNVANDKNRCDVVGTVTVDVAPEDWQALQMETHNWFDPERVSIDIFGITFRPAVAVLPDPEASTAQ